MPFQPGQSGNPGGRPKKMFSISMLLREGLQEKHDVCDCSNAQVICQVLMDAACSGNVEAAMYICDRVDGRPFRARPPQEEIELTSDLVDHVDESIVPAEKIAEKRPAEFQEPARQAAQAQPIVPEKTMAHAPAQPAQSTPSQSKSNNASPLPATVPLAPPLPATPARDRELIGAGAGPGQLHRNGKG